MKQRAHAFILYLFFVHIIFVIVILLNLFTLLSVRPNIFIGRVEGSAMYQKWYFEVTIDHIEQTTHMLPHMRVGWASTAG